MFMVEEYYYLKLRAAKKESMLERASKTISSQERIIQEMTCFMHDCLDIIFDKVRKKQTQIIQCMRLSGDKISNTNDAFKLY